MRSASGARGRGGPDFPQDSDLAVADEGVAVWQDRKGALRGGVDEGGGGGEGAQDEWGG